MPEPATTVLLSPILAVRRWLAAPSAPEQFPRVQALVDGAAALLSEANDLEGRGEAVPALVVYREAFRQLSAARRLAVAPEVDSTEAAQLKNLFEQPKDVETLFALDTSSVSEGDARALRRACRRAARQLESFLQSDLGYTTAGVRFERLLLLVGGLAAVGAIAVGVALAPRNLALGRPVTASSVRFGNPDTLTNGAVEWGTFGLRTAAGGAWATIDLGDLHSLAEARIYGRGDRDYRNGLPVEVQLSDDGSRFRSVASCTTPITQATPCAAPLRHERARYVRVSADEVVLSEVEVLEDR
jgi:hypothetical protein